MRLAKASGLYIIALQSLLSSSREFDRPEGIILFFIAIAVAWFAGLTLHRYLSDLWQK